MVIVSFTGYGCFSTFLDSHSNWFAGKVGGRFPWWQLLHSLSDHNPRNPGPFLDSHCQGKVQCLTAQLVDAMNVNMNRKPATNRKTQMLQMHVSAEYILFRTVAVSHWNFTRGHHFLTFLNVTARSRQDLEIC